MPTVGSKAVLNRRVPKFSTNVGRIVLEDVYNYFYPQSTCELAKELKESCLLFHFLLLYTKFIANLLSLSSVSRKTIYRHSLVMFRFGYSLKDVIVGHTWLYKSFDWCLRAKIEDLVEKSIKWSDICMSWTLFSCNYHQLPTVWRLIFGVHDRNE